MKLVLPLPENRANRKGSTHWARVKGDRDAYVQAAKVAVWQQAKAGARAALADGHVAVTATLYVWARMDDDNAVARLKWPLDVLKKTGVIHDDKRPWCRLTGIPEQVIDRKHQRVELVIEAAA